MSQRLQSFVLDASLNPFNVIEPGKRPRVTLTPTLALKDGKPWRIGANNGVLLNAGGFAHNQAMRDQYIPHTRNEWTHAAPGDTGDMHREMVRIGAWMAQMGTVR